MIRVLKFSGLKQQLMILKPLDGALVNQTEMVIINRYLPIEMFRQN